MGTNSSSRFGIRVKESGACDSSTNDLESCGAELFGYGKGWREISEKSAEEVNPGVQEE